MAKLYKALKKTGRNLREIYNFGHALVKRIEVGHMEQEEGFAYKVFVENTFLGTQKWMAVGILYENGVPLPWPKVTHEEIRQRGEGRYSFWYSAVYFSTTDNSDPRTNGRQYTIQYNLQEFVTTLVWQFLYRMAFCVVLTKIKR